MLFWIRPYKYSAYMCQYQISGTGGLLVHGIMRDLRELQRILTDCEQPAVLQ